MKSASAGVSVAEGQIVIGGVVVPVAGRGEGHPTILPPLRLAGERQPCALPAPRLGGMPSRCKATRLGMKFTSSYMPTRGWAA